MADDLKQTLRENLVALMAYREGALPSGESGVSRLKRMGGISIGTAQRILGGETSVGLDNIQALAAGFGVAPWQLLVPGLDPASLPGLTEDATAWPFSLVDRAAYRGLSNVDRTFVQGAMANAIAARTKALPAAAPVPAPASAEVSKLVAALEATAPEVRDVISRRARASIPSTVREHAARKGAKPAPSPSDPAVPKPSRQPLKSR